LPQPALQIDAAVRDGLQLLDLETPVFEERPRRHFRRSGPALRRVLARGGQALFRAASLLAIRRSSQGSKPRPLAMIRSALRTALASSALGW